MEDILKAGTDTTSFGLSDLVETQPAVTNVPAKSVRNRAATSALLAGEPDKMLEKYRLLMQEGMEGSEVTHGQVLDALEEQNRTKSMSHVISILGDATIPLDQKKRLMSFVQTNGFKEEPAQTLRTKALEVESKGENLRGEAARISLSDSMYGIDKEAQERQRMLNGAMAELGNEGTARAVGDLAVAEVMPFGRNVIGAKIAAKQAEADGEEMGIGGWVKNLLLPGSTRADLQKKLLNTPPDKRGPMTAKLLQSIKDGSSVFPSDNYYSQYKEATRILDTPSHSNGEIWAENLMTVLDAFWVGGEISALGRSTKKFAGTGPAGETVTKANWELVDDPFNPLKPKLANPQAKIEASRNDALKRIKMNSVVREENAVTPFNIIEQTNPGAARAMHDSIMQSSSDEIAEALTGVSREQAIINNVYPQVGSESGAVLNKVSQDIREVITNTGATRYTPDELDSAVNTIKRDFRDASGLEINDTMTTFRVDGDHMLVDAHYATPGGAFTTPEAARAQATFALKDYGILPEEIVIMKRNGMEYVPVEGGEAAGDYIVKVKSRLPISDDQVTSWNPLDVKRNWLDRISWTGSENKGNLSGWLFDPGSMLHPTITGSASIAADQAITLENLFLKPIKEFRSKVSAYPAARRTMVEDYLKEANTNGIRQDRFDLVARGFTDDEINTLKQWKDIWDTHYYIENFDLVRTLNSQGYQVFDTAGTQLFAKPIQKNSTIKNVYDPLSNSVVMHTQDDLDTLYNTNGTYAALRRPIQVQGVEVEHMIVRNTPTEYLRKLRDTDSVLNYREGYYTVSYNKGSKFVDEITMDASGKESRRTVAVAGNTSDAKMFADSQQANTGNLHVIREDSRGFAKDGDGYWDVNDAAGRIAQRLRGKPLHDATGINQLGSGVFVENPMESAARAARSLAGRTVNRPMLETAKKRFMEQYGDMVQSQGTGYKTFPTSRTEIVDHANHASARVADARTTYGYIKYLEDGYINSADQVFKGGMRAIEGMLGDRGWSMLEKAAQKVGNVAPSHFAKQVVFQAYIVGSNPIRQWIVQSHQATRMMAFNPIGIMNGGVHGRIVGYLGEYSGFKQTNAAVKSFTKFVDDSGMVAGVDRNSLVRGLGLSMADSSSKTKRVLGAIGSTPQTLGFDLGEKMNQLGHLAAVHEKYWRAGADLTDKTVRDMALTEARALSYDLNKAGELTYTQSTPAMILQFLQMPHKSMLQLANRKIPTSVALRLAAWDLLMWGVGGGAAYSIVNGIVTAITDNPDGILPEDPENREKFVYGMESFYLNKFFTLLDDSGDNTRIDFSALAPNDMDGWARMYHALMDDGVYAAFAASPAGQLMAIDGVNDSRRNGRIPKAVLTLGRFMNVVEEVDPENPTEFTSVLNDVAKISSGWTAAENAKLMYETRKKLDAAGNVVSSQVTIPEVWATGLGFGQLAVKDLYRISKNRQEDKKSQEEAVMRKYRSIVSYVTQELEKENTNVDHIQKVSSMLLRSFDNPEDLALVRKQWASDLAGKDNKLMKDVLTAAGLPDSKRIKDDIKMMPTDDETKALMLQRVDDVRMFRKPKE